MIWKLLSAAVVIGAVLYWLRPFWAPAAPPRGGAIDLAPCPRCGVHRPAGAPCACASTPTP